MGKRKKPKYSNKIYYKNKLMGACHYADGLAYEIFMETCDNNAALVLCEYNYFSPELKAILEKVAEIQLTDITSRM